ncbi:hypothetical protein K474DRAFT_1233489 [Panus rudis PR-1116 ss-1]|nr:hypothetical protein K474DRAFT_1233489 [Panus rudis PR-1116 ss-1]
MPMPMMPCSSRVECVDVVFHALSLVSAFTSAGPAVRLRFGASCCETYSLRALLLDPSHYIVSLPKAEPSTISYPIPPL